MILNAGEQVERYRVEGLVGSGGMARVYRVRHARLGSLHAVKLLRLPTPSVIERLLREGRAQSSLRHPNIVPVTDVIDVDGAPGLVMEWVGGPDLGALLGEVRLSPAEIDAVARALFAGIGAAHDAGWVHRDLKPSNVLLQPVSGELVARITDFGLVKALEGERSGDGPRTHTGALMGTPAYMAPEQLLDSGAVDHRADVWALGALLFEICTNRRVFEATTPRGLLDAHTQPIPSLADERPDLPAGAAAAVAWALRADLAERAPSVAALAQRWSLGQWPSPHRPWSPEVWAAAARLSEPSPPASPSGAEPAEDSRTLSVGSEIFAPPAPVAPPPAEVVAPAEAPLSRGVVAAGALGVAGLAALGLAALGLGLAMREAPERGAEVLTATSVPVVTPDAAAQEQLELAWTAFLQGDRAEARRRLASARVGAPDSPLPDLLLSYVLLRDDLLSDSLATSAAAARRSGDTAGPAGSLARAVGAQQRAGRVDVPEMAEHHQRYPDDLLALLMSVDFCAMIDVATCEREIPRLLAAAPRAPLAYQVAAESWQELGDGSRAREVLSLGLAVSPDDPTLLELRSRDELQLRDYPAARATLDRLKRVEPGSAAVGPLRVRLAVLDGDAPGLAALRAELTSPSQPIDTRYGFYDAAADTLAGLGRVAESAALLGESRELARREGTPADHFLATLDERGAAHARGDTGLAAEILDEAASIAAHNPEVPRDQRDRLTGFLLHNQGLQALGRGEVEVAEALVTRLRGADGVSPDAVENLAREVAVARGDVDGVLKLGATLWNGECERASILGDAVLRAGSPDRAEPLLRAAVDSGCTLYTRQRGQAVLAHLGLAEIAASAGDGAAARAHVAAARDLWPNPDADHLAAARLLRVSARVGETSGAPDAP